LLVPCKFFCLPVEKNVVVEITVFISRVILAATFFSSDDVEHIAHTKYFIQNLLHGAQHLVSNVDVNRSFF